MTEDLSHKQRLAAAILAAAAFISLLALTAPGSAQASNGTCNWSEGVWACNYGANFWPKETKLWFESSGGNNERNWHVNYAYDGYGGSVYKCAGYKRWDGAFLNQACGTPNGILLSIPESWRPGWIYIIHFANGPRNISGFATHG